MLTDFKGKGVILSRDATIPFFPNRSDTANSEDRPIPIQSDTGAVKKKNAVT